MCRPADYLPSGTVGQWPPATGQWWNERRGGDPKTDRASQRGGVPKTDRATQRGGDPKTDQRKEELSKQLGVEGKGPENPGVVAPLTSASCRGNYWWDWTSTAGDVLSRRHLEHFDNEFDLAGPKSFGCLEVDYVKPLKIVSSSPFVTV